MATKVALCIGINDYPGTNADLLGCVNDANDWAILLESRGFETSRLLDTGATKQAIVEEMQAALAAVGAGETAIITFSGHGTWIPDLSGDEPDRRDEALCPYDIQDAQVITDDELYEIFTDRKRGSRAILISDSCHSGSVARLFNPLGVSQDRVRYLGPESFLTGRALKLAAATTSRPVPSTRPHAALLMAGCEDWEFSFDAMFADRSNGAFTRVALDALSGLPLDATYRDWQKKIRTKLPSRDYPQTPQLVGTDLMKRWRVLV